MPAIDFRAVRSLLPPARVLELLGWVPVRSSGDERRGPCPLHRSDLPRSRSFAVNLRKGVFHCFHCGASGNLLELYATARGLRLYDAAVQLCNRLGLELPWLAPPARAQCGERTPGNGKLGREQAGAP
jgi:DNA primase